MYPVKTLRADQHRCIVFPKLTEELNFPKLKIIHKHTQIGRGEKERGLYINEEREGGGRKRGKKRDDDSLGSVVT